MNSQRLILLSGLIALLNMAPAIAANPPRHTFTLGTNEFLLDGRPFQMRSGEIHPARIPKEYWRHRVRLAKAMGLNTIAAYIFWSYHEPQEGRFDFKSGNRDLADFFRIVQQEGMYLFLRPGPYCCAEYDWGGLPPYLLRDPELKVRCMDSGYIQPAERYLKALAKVVAPWQITRGGPIVLLQVENEYGSYGNDRAYVEWLHDLWRRCGISIPFSTGDGATPHMLEAGSLPGCAVGLDPGSSLKDWEVAQRMNPGVPVFSSETYPGWLTHWGEPWARVSTEKISSEVKFLMDNKKSFSLYMFHGGTSFGFMAGANANALPVASNGLACSFMPDITSYDYDAPVTEQGRITPKYTALRNVIASYDKSASPLPAVPDPLPTMNIPAITMEAWTTLWDHLPDPVRLAQPTSFESLGQNQGLMVYRTRLVGRKSGRLVLRDLNDYALVFLDGKWIGTLDRRLGQNTIDIPPTESAQPVLEVLVEAMGHINFGEFLVDRKGITDRALLNGMTLMGWEIFRFPLADRWAAKLGRTPFTGSRPGALFRGKFQLEKTADTFFDLSGYRKGYVWVNGHNLGRYWDIGPQKRLYCPATWLQLGSNEIRVLDLHETQPKPIEGKDAPDAVP